MVLSSVNDCGISLIAIGLSVTSVNKNVIKSTWERNAQALIVILILGLLLI